MSGFIIFLVAGFVMIPAIIQTVRFQKSIDYISRKYGIEKEKIQLYFNQEVDDFKKENKEFEDDMHILVQLSTRMAVSAMARGLLVIFLFIVADYFKIFK